MTTIPAPALSDTRLLAPEAASAALRFPDRHALASALDAAGLTGRGGAGFPTARKLGQFLENRVEKVVVIGNAMEGETLSHKDAVLLQRAPGLVLDGLQVVAHALGSPRAILAVGAQIPAAAVIAEAQAPARRHISAEVRVLPHAFVAGQETALVQAINGARAVPRDRRDPIARHGVDRRPTLVLNAETLAHIALIVRHGAGWWRSAGTADEPGTTLVTISGSSPGIVGQPGVVEIQRGAMLSAVLTRAGTDLSRTSAVLVGGYHGAWVPAGALDIALARASLAPFGATPGAGVLHVLDAADCPLEAVAGITGFLARESAGQCGPCVNGLPAMATALTDLAHRPTAAAALPQRVAQLADLVDGRGACAHPDGTARLVRSTLHVFAAHVQAHLEGRCPR